MNWESLFDDLGKCTAKRLFTSDESREYRQLSVLGGNEILYAPDTLYFSDWETFVRVSPDTDISVLLFAEEGVDIRMVLKSTFNSAVFYSEEEYRAFYRTCDEILREESRFEAGIHGLAEVVYKNEDLFSLINKISDLYGHPVNLMDTTYSVIAFSSNHQFDIKDLKNDDFRIGGYIPPEIINTLNLNDMSTPVYENTVMIPHVYGEFIHYRTPILMNNVCIAYFSVYYMTGETASAAGIRYLTRISRLISLAMQIQDYNSLNKDNYYNSLFASLLTGNNIQERDWETRIRAYGYHLKKYRYIFVAAPSEPKGSRVKTNELSITLHHIINNSIYAILNGHIILMASFDEKEDLLKEILEKCRLLTESHGNLKIGISSRFTKLKDVKNCVREAQDAIELAPYVSNGSKVLRYDSCRLHNMALALSAADDPNRFFVHELADLMEYDREHGSDLLYTFFVVLTNPGGMAEACRKLHIHRNTLYFRLSKITEITGLAYEDPAVSAAILFSFIFMRINGTINYRREDH